MLRVRSQFIAAVVLTISAGCSSSNGSSKPAAPIDNPQPAAPADMDEPLAGRDAEADRQALIEAGYAYVKEVAAEGLVVDIEIHGIESDYALLLVMPESQDADNALALMKRDGETWKGLTLGTGMDCDLLLEFGAPEALCSKL